MSEFLDVYFSGFQEVLRRSLSEPETRDNLARAVSLLSRLKGGDHTAYLIGNGGSAAVAEHMAVDFAKCNKIRAITLSNVPMLTCFVNDYGPDKALSKFLERYGRSGDVLLAISSSGVSQNILNACATARERGMTVVTFSGFKSDNPLRKTGDINFWVNSRSYGYLEIIHNLLIHYINDALYGAVEYTVKD